MCLRLVKLDYGLMLFKKTAIVGFLRDWRYDLERMMGLITYEEQFVPRGQIGMDAKCSKADRSSWRSVWMWTEGLRVSEDAL